MKIGFTGVYRDMTGYGHAALEIIKAIHAAGGDIAIRPIQLTQSAEQIPDNDFYSSLEQKPMQNIDVMIQAYLPELMVRNGTVKNVGHFFCETTNFRASGWQHYLNNMNSVCVASKQNHEACQASNVTVPIKTIPVPTDINKYNYLPDEFPLPGLDGKFVFYSIGDYSTRKNYRQLLQAYLSTFTKDDPVVLILKTFIAGRTAQDSYNIISQEIEKIKEGLRLHRTGMYPQIILICDRLSESEMISLHHTGDCFVIAEHGSGWGIPAFDAMAMNKFVIAPSWGSHTDFLESYSRYIPIKSYLDRCFGVENNECPYDLYTAYENWAYMASHDIRDALFAAVNASNSKKPFAPADLTPYSYQSVGTMWIEYLRGLL